MDVIRAFRGNKRARGGVVHTPPRVTVLVHKR